jgi:hypothetical protein
MNCRENITTESMPPREHGTPKQALHRKLGTDAGSPSIRGAPIVDPAFDLIKNNEESAEA